MARFLGEVALESDWRPVAERWLPDHPYARRAFAELFATPSARLYASPNQRGVSLHSRRSSNGSTSVSVRLARRRATCHDPALTPGVM